mmetsp:Transcript_9048/g.27051  ORF Transcript_9048/g.27051 Transcript_9048/m.27051 type:complete len:385 (-) Transcript_9048:123-1277(-)
MDRKQCCSVGILLLELLAFSSPVTASISATSVSVKPLGFAGGFGGGFGAKKASAAKKSKKKRKKGSLLADVAVAKKSSAQADKPEEGPKLDRFGLPIPTEDDYFPSPPEGTELIPIPMDYSTKMTDVKAAMEKHIQLDFDLFDEEGIENIPVDISRDPMKLSLVHKSPPVLCIENFFSPEECENYISLSEPDSNMGALEVQSKTFALATSTRTSTTWFCHYERVPTLLAKARRLLKGLDLEQMEEPQLVRYRTGEQFSWHYDEIPAPQLENGGQRIATLLVYLRTLDEGRGGGTVFRDLLTADRSSKLTVRPVLGSALLFFPSFADGTPDDRTLHKGEVAIDEKMIAQMWIHERKYSPAVPEGNSHAAAADALKAKEGELGYSN